MTFAWLGAIAQMMPPSSKCPVAHQLANGNFRPEVGGNDLIHPHGTEAHAKDRHS